MACYMTSGKLQGRLAVGLWTSTSASFCYQNNGLKLSRIQYLRVERYFFSRHNSSVYHLYIRVVTELNVNIVASSLLVENIDTCSFRYWIRIVKCKAQTPNTSFHQRTLVVERQSH